ncbi:MAG: hypothetical protein ACRDOT_05565 [Aeromicrobium sp.]
MRWRSRGGSRSPNGADVTLIVHRFEKAAYQAFIDDGFGGPYLVMTLLRELRRRGVVRRVHLASDSGPRSSGVAILHVNATVISSEYAQFAAGFDRCVNLKVTDISKRSLSTVLAEPGWPGEVFVKSNLNYGGRPEVRLNKHARMEGLAEPFPGAVAMAEYGVFPSIDDVPADQRSDPQILVERFVPERDEQGFATRHWVFCGTAGYCNRYVSPEPLVKGRNVISRQQAPVPEYLREIRRARGFDFGKFDFVVHDEQVVLLDVNKTPGRIPATGRDVESRVAVLADGLQALIAGGST